MTALLYIFGVVIFIAAIFASIALHELGHLKYAKRYGCRVSEYMIGFGPLLFSRTKGETTYGLKLIPLGGYVKIIGMFPPDKDEQAKQAAPESVVADAGDSDAATVAATNAASSGESTLTLRKSNTGLFAQMISETRSSGREEIEPEDADRLFYKLPWHQKVMTMLAGPGTNIVIAFICLQSVYGLYGLHSLEPTGSTVVEYVADCVIPQAEDRTTCADTDPETPAAKAGMKSGDQIVAINGNIVKTWDQTQKFVTNSTPDERAVFEVMRDGKKLTLEPTALTVMVRDVSNDGSGQMAKVGYLGVRFEQHEVVTRGGPFFTMGHMGEMTAAAVSSIADLPSRVWNVAMAIISDTQRDQDGPMSIVGGSRLAGEVASADEATTGLQVADKAALLALVVGSFNLFIGFFNLIPVLPLDGGHIAGALWEQLRRLTAKVFRRKDPGYVDVAQQMPIAYGLGFSLLVCGVVLIIGDIIVPISTGL